MGVGLVAFHGLAPVARAQSAPNGAYVHEPRSARQGGRLTRSFRPLRASSLRASRKSNFKNATYIKNAFFLWGRLPAFIMPFGYLLTPLYPPPDPPAPGSCLTAHLNIGVWHAVCALAALAPEGVRGKLGGNFC